MISSVPFARLSGAALLASLACVIVPAVRAATAAPTALTAPQARDQLRKEWADFLSRSATPLLKAATLTEAQRPEPERAALAAAATVSFQQPAEVWSVDGTLSVTLVGMKAHNRIGDDPVYLRSYNGQLVGPTLRAKPGDRLRITLRNDFKPEADHPGEMNTLHAFNVMNLHTHGLNVSPSGISDNVLLDVGPQSSQDYEVVIPRNHPSGTFWYHTHRHGSTAAQVSSGMAGAIIITGGMDDVPEIARARERILVLQQIAYLYKNTFTDKGADGKETTVTYDLPYGVIEAEYENRIFPPGSWDKLGRHTTINGVKLPVFRAQPGSVERWRVIHAGIREAVKLKLERAPGASTALPESIVLHEIAADGLSLGRVSPEQVVELWPGYRSDILVQFPNVPAGEYLLVDEASPQSLTGLAESRKYLARIIVGGDAKPMTLPQDVQLAKFRLPSIPASTPGMGQQTVSYGIFVDPNPTGGVTVTFNVNGRPFSMERARELTLGAVDDWTLMTRNRGIAANPPSHPHHIHVNPFEVYSIKDDKGVERLKAPIWRDTIITHEGWTVKARSRYETFTGLFVQHCHILDHEDQGMMELVEIKHPFGAKKTTAALDATGNPSLRVARPFAAPAWELSDAAGRARRLAEFRGRPAVLFFFKGHGCLHCTEQIALFRAYHEKFRELGADVIGVSTDEVADLAAALQLAPTPFLLVSDAARQAFRAYACQQGDETLHGTFVLDAAGAVRWKTIGESPFVAIDNLVAEVARLAPRAAPGGTATAALSP